MATRREIREAFYDELETATTSHLDSSDIRQDDPDSQEELPAIVHNDNYREIPMNRGAAPTDVVTDDDGEQEYIYTSIEQAAFTVTVVSDDEQVKEDIYGALRSHFDRYTHPIEDASSIQSDVYRVEVNDTTSTDQTDRDPRVRGDALGINLNYQRHQSRDVDPTTDVEHNVDADSDGTIDEVYTTTN